MTSLCSGQTMLYIFYFNPMGNTETAKNEWLPPSRGPRVGWINKHTVLHADEYAFVSAHAFPSLSHEYMWFLVPQSFTMCIVYVWYWLLVALAGLIFKAALGKFRSWNGCKSNSNRECNHRYYSNVSCILMEQFLFFSNFISFTHHSSMFLLQPWFQKIGRLCKTLI